MHFDGGPSACNETILTCQDLEDGSEEEPSALNQLKQLIQKGNEGEDAEDDRQNHEGLNCLDPVYRLHREDIEWCGIKHIHDLTDD